MKQSSVGLHLFVVSTLTIQLVTLFLCQVQGGIITNQQSLTLPKELADSIVAAASNTDAADITKNGTRTGRVMYTAPYSNVRIASKEPKSLKYFPIPAVISKKHKASPTVIVPVLRTSTTSIPSTLSTTTSSTSITSSTTTTSPTTTTTPPPPATSSPSPPTSTALVVEETVPDIIEILEETEPENDEELVTETVSTSGGDFEENEDDIEDAPVTEQTVEDE